MDPSHFLLYNNKLQHMHKRELFSFDYYSIYFTKLTFIYMYLIRRFYSDKREASIHICMVIWKKPQWFFYLIFKNFYTYKNASIANMNEEQRLNCRSLNIYRKNIELEWKGRERNKKKVNHVISKTTIVNFIQCYQNSFKQRIKRWILKDFFG